MDIFTLRHSGSSYVDGEMVNGLVRKQWVERYLEPGEFVLVGSPTDELRAQLAIGTLISHVDTEEVMIVEDHQIEEKVGAAPVFTVSGRSLDSFIESRVATDNGLGFNGKLDDGVAPKVLYDGTGWPFSFDSVTPPELAVALLEMQLESTKTIRTSFAIPDLAVLHNITTTYTRKDQDLPRGDLASQIMDILGDIEAGIKIQRPNESHAKIKFLIHKGVNLATSVRFSYERGEILGAKYLWSSRDYRNSAYISTRYQGLYYSLGGTESETGLARRVTFIDATDIEKATSFSRVSYINSLLKARAKRELKKKKKDRILFEAQIHPFSRYQYRKNYNIGDVVRVDGNYDISANMRVIEYVETDDGDGSGFGVPTLEAVRTSDDSDVDVYTWESQGGESGVT